MAKRSSTAIQVASISGVTIRGSVGGEAIDTVCVERALCRSGRGKAHTPVQSTFVGQRSDTGENEAGNLEAYLPESIWKHPQ
jgi:hypothetical protein